MPEFIAMTLKQMLSQGSNPPYPQSEKDYDEFLSEDIVQINGKNYTLSAIQKRDIKIMADQLDNQLRRQNPLIHDMFGRNALRILDLVRMVNVNSKQGFKGVAGGGNELDIQLMTARTLYDPDSSGNTRSEFERAISSTGSKNFIEGASSGTEVTMAEEEGFIILGLYNPAVDPCVGGVQIIMNTEPYNVQTLDFNQQQDEYGDVLIELKAPWTLPPEQSGEMLAYYYQTGTDEMQPIGLWVKQARNLRSLTSMRSTSST